MENETITAKSKYIRQSPYKLRLVLNLIRGLPVSEALDILKFTKRKASDEITKVIQSAMANAENNFGLNSNDLYISKAIADEGPTLKRFRPRARGRSGKILKPFSRVRILVEEKEEVLKKSDSEKKTANNKEGKK